MLISITERRASYYFVGGGGDWCFTPQNLTIWVKSLFFVLDLSKDTLK